MRKIITKEIHPPLSTWTIWMILDWIVLVVMWQKGISNGSIIAATGGATIISLLLLKGSWKWSSFDSGCSVLGAIGAIAYMMMEDPTLGITFFLAAITTGALPSFKKAWENPELERKAISSWAMRSLACAITMINTFVTKEWSVTSLAQPIVFTAIMLTMVLLLLRRKT